MRLPRIPGSFDPIAGSLNSMFEFHHPAGRSSTLFLDPTTGQPTSHGGHGLDRSRRRPAVDGPRAERRAKDRRGAQRVAVAAAAIQVPDPYWRLPCSSAVPGRMHSGGSDRAPRVDRCDRLVAKAVVSNRLDGTMKAFVRHWSVRGANSDRCRAIPRGHRRQRGAFLLVSWSGSAADVPSRRRQI